MNNLIQDIYKNLDTNDPNIELIANKKVDQITESFNKGEDDFIVNYVYDYYEINYANYYNQSLTTFNS